MKELMLGFLLIETRNHIANKKCEQFLIKIIYLLSDSAIDVTFTTKLVCKRCAKLRYLSKLSSRLN